MELDEALAALRSATAGVARALGEVDLSALTREQLLSVVQETHRASNVLAGVETVAVAHVAAVEDVERGIYGIQFHPEVVHTPYGQQILTTFLADICGCERSWSAASIIEEQVAAIRAQVGGGRVICGLSGGVDSSVAALLVHRAVGDRLTCVFVDHGLMRRNEGEQVISAFRDHFKVPLVAVDAEDRFLARLAGLSARGSRAGRGGSGRRPGTRCRRP